MLSAIFPSSDSLQISTSLSMKPLSHLPMVLINMVWTNKCMLTTSLCVLWGIFLFYKWDFES